MITCPNCGKQNADEAAHCGFCGHQLNAGNKPLKTMFGMNALDPELLKQALETKAPAAAPPADPEPVEPGPPMPTSIPKLNLPKPGGLPPLGGLRPPAPASDEAYGATEAMPALTAPNPSIGAAPDPFVDEFAALEAQFGHEFAPNKPPADDDDSSSPTEMHDTSGLLDEPLGGPLGGAPRETPMFNMGAKPSGDPFSSPSGDPFGSPPPARDPFASPGAPPMGDPFGPPASQPPGMGGKPAGDPFAPPGAAPRGNLPAPMPGGGQMVKKDNTKLFIAAGVVIFVMLISCAGLLGLIFYAA